jgi:hypothetical protein
MTTWADKVDNAQGLIDSLQDFADLHPAQLHSLQALLHYGDELGEAIQDLHECRVELQESSRGGTAGTQDSPLYATRHMRAGNRG